VDGISNWEVAENIKPGTYLHAYLEYAASQTDAPWLYHIGCGLAALATVMPPTVRFYHHGHWLYGNLWIMLIGKSGRDRKTTAVRIAKELVQAVNPDLIGVPPGSPQGLQESLIEKPFQMIAMEELGDHLGQTQNRGMEAIRTTMNIAYDGGPIGRALAAGPKQADKVRLTVLGGTTPAYLESYTDETARTGGYLNRYGMMLARREHHLETVIPDFDRRLKVAKWLQSAHTADCEYGAIGFTEEAAALWSRWGRGVEVGIEAADQEISGTIARAQEFALKVALILSVGESQHNPKSFWPIDAPCLALAIKIAGWHVRGADQVLHNLAGTQFQRNRRRLISFLETGVKTRGHIARYMKMPPRDVDTVLLALKTEGRILAAPQGTHVAWKLQSEAEAEAAEKEGLTVEDLEAKGVKVLGAKTPPKPASIPAPVPINGGGKGSTPEHVLQASGATPLPRMAAQSVPDPEDYNDVG
jgi:hypothetical protein